MEVKKGILNQTDVIVAGAIVLILGVLIVPVPTTLLDLLLVMNIGLAVLILIMTTQLKDALDLSSFPSLLLILTLFRLSLNVATTRQILLRGFAGNVIQSFGDFVVGGNYIIGVVIFLILVVINFMVITKGSGRVAEVAARFTLDAMPGKQMSIDADLNAGLIDENVAIERREKLVREADFYGAMDGASKFVRGDAIAGLIITIINITAGFAVGMLQQGMTAADAITKYTILTVGDGLVAQVPALIISTAAGVLVTRAASNETMGAEISTQLFFKPKPLMLTGGILTAIAFVPGLPFLPFLALGGTIGGMGIAMKKNAPEQEQEKESESKAGMGKLPGGKAAGALPPAASKVVPSISPVDLEIGFGLVSLVDSKQGGKLIDRIGVVRGQLAEELGFVLPPVNVRDNIKLKNNEYCIRIRGLEIARDSVKPGFLMAINPGGEEKLEGCTAVTEPTFGFQAYWIPEEKRSLAESKGMTVVDAASVVTTHLTEEAKRHAADLISRQDVSDMIDRCKETHPSVVQELIPAKLSIGGVHRVLQGLLEERVSIRNLPLILETISDQAGRTQDTGLLVEFSRRELGGHICHSHLAQDGSLPAVGIHPDLQTILKKGTHREGSEVGSLILDPRVAQGIVESIRQAIEPLAGKGMEPVLLCSPVVRPQLRHLTRHKFRELAVISFAEVPDSIRVEMLGIVAAPKGVEVDELLSAA